MHTRYSMFVSQCHHFNSFCVSVTLACLCPSTLRRPSLEHVAPRWERSLQKHCQTKALAKITMYAITYQKKHELCNRMS